MAGRGAVITVELLGEEGNTEALHLPVALHSPLQVLKEQLEQLTSIPIRDQVLILCDLTDVERNNDVLLEGRGMVSLSIHPLPTHTSTNSPSHTLCRLHGLA